MRARAREEDPISFWRLAFGVFVGGRVYNRYSGRWEVRCTRGEI